MRMKDTILRILKISPLTNVHGNLLCICLQKHLRRNKSIVYSGHLLDNFAFQLVLESKFEGSKSKEVTSEDIKKLSIKKITSSNLFYFAGCFFFEMGREFKKNNLSLVLFNRLKILHIIPVGLISKKENNLACAAHFFVHFFDIVSHNYNVKIPSYTSYISMQEMSCVLTKSFVACVPVRYFFPCRSFSPWRPLAFLFLSPPIFMFFFQRNLSPFSDLQITKFSYPW